MLRPCLSGRFDLPQTATSDGSSRPTAPQLTYDASVEEALCYGWIDSTLNPIDGTRYMQLFTPRKAKSGWSRLNKRRAAKLIADGLMTAAGREKIASKPAA